MRRLLPALLVCVLLPVFVPARAEAADFAPGPAEACRIAIAATERARQIPPLLLAAIARVESGRADPSGRIRPWPWTINAAGEGFVFPTKQAAIAAVREKRAAGITSIDVGCLQVNLAHHPEAFPDLETAFDPAANAAYAGRFLAELRARTGDWAAAAAQYHSATPELGAAYRAKVLAAWPEEKRAAQARLITGLPADAGRIIAPGLAQSGQPLLVAGARVNLPRPVRLTKAAPPPRRLPRLGPELAEAR